MRSSLRLHGVVLAVAVGSMAVGGTAFASTGAAAAATRTLSYQGYTFSVPASWPVVDLGSQPTACVRYDRHAVYLGTPGAEQNCPANVTGHTEALLLQPAAAGGGTSIVQHTVSDEFDATAPGISITGTYGSDPGQIAGILTRALPAGTPMTDAPDKPSSATGQAAGKSTANPAPISSQAFDFTGQGFDACTAPSESDMAQWRNYSPYDSIGLYIGGADRSCAQPQLTAQWLSDEANAGWHFWLMYVGLQAPGTTCEGCGVITNPATQALAAAQDAVTRAQSLGVPAGVPIIYDMEPYTPSTTNSATTVSFESDWTADLHALGYQSGIYGTPSSTVQDLIDNIGVSGVTEPDTLDFASGNGAQNVNYTAVPAGTWAGSSRINQNGFNLSQQFGSSSTISIDTDYVDVQRDPYFSPGGSVFTLASGTDDVQELVGNGAVAGVGQGLITIGGPASQLYVGLNTVYALNATDTEISVYDGIPGEWTQIGGGGSEFAVVGDTLYGLTTSESAVMEYTGAATGWKSVGGAASAIFGGSLGLFALNPGNTDLYGFNATSGAWTLTGGGGSEFAEAGNTLYGLATNRSYVAQWSGTGTTWTVVGGAAQDLYGSPNGISGGLSPALYASSPGGAVLEYLGTPQKWTELDGSALSFSSTQSGLYTLESNGIFSYEAGSWVAVGGDAASIAGSGGVGSGG